jgi:hypothetical protein
MTPAASTSALEPCVPESIAPRSSAEASRALERRPNPQELSPETHPVAREACRLCHGSLKVRYLFAGVVFIRTCYFCTGRHVPAAKRESEQGSNTEVTGAKRPV